MIFFLGGGKEKMGYSSTKTLPKKDSCGVDMSYV